MKKKENKKLNDFSQLAKWIPIKVRPLDEEEKSYYGEDYCFIWDCKLPDDGEEVLVTTASGHVDIDTFYDGYFENYSNHDDLLAWMPMPEPYRKER